MRRKLTFTALAATTLSIGLGVGATLATDTPAQRTPTVSTVTGKGNADHMCSAGMAAMMGSAGMDPETMAVMHTERHAAMSEHMSVGHLAACASAHRSINDGSSMISPDPGSADLSRHPSHHPGSRP